MRASKSDCRRVFATYAVSAIAIWASAPQLAAQVSSLPARTEAPSIQAAEIPAGLLQEGDHLKIAIFERLNVTGSDHARKATAQFSDLASFQRMDISGEYTISDDGTFVLPRLGLVRAEGRSPGELQAVITELFKQTTGRAAEVTVAIADRAPVYVVGSVRSNGAFKFQAGMFALQAIALAGGVDDGRAAGGSSAKVEAERERERQRRAVDQLNRLLVRRARLDAESKGSTKLEAPLRLISTKDPRYSRELVASELAILRLHRAKSHQHREQAQGLVRAANREVIIQRRKADVIAAQIEARAERLADVRDMQSKGLTTRNSLAHARYDSADIQSRYNDALIAVAQAEARAEQAELAKTQLSIEAEEQLLSAIAATDREIGELRQTLDTAQTVVELFDRDVQHHSRAQSRITYKIIRRTKSGMVTLRAEEASLLQPGDVIKVETEKVPQDPLPDEIFRPTKT
ncbi:MAG: polysaccharide biosynthesis/export family protein [Proteobacteria bacterium]|nr:polysaccharide biosynthesis/export family protein [Pseudomonadota bacterium]